MEWAGRDNDLFPPSGFASRLSVPLDPLSCWVLRLGCGEALLALASQLASHPLRGLRSLFCSVRQLGQSEAAHALFSRNPHDAQRVAARCRGAEHPMKVGGEGRVSGIMQTLSNSANPCVCITHCYI